MEVHARLRRLRCPEHGALVEGVPFARDGARFTADFEDLVAWLMTKCDRTTTCRLARIDWHTVGRIIKRVADEQLDEDRLTDLFEISIDEVSWRKGHRYLTLVGDHTRGCVVWGCEGKGQAAADRFFAELGLAPRVVMEADETEAIKRMVECGFGYSILPQFALRDRLSRFQTFRVAGHRLVRQQALAMPRSDYPRVLTAAVARFLQNALARA